MGWFSPGELPLGEMGELTRALVRDLGLTGVQSTTGQPLLVLVTGLQGTGKSTVAGLVAELLGAPLIAHDWAMSGLRPFPAFRPRWTRWIHPDTVWWGGHSCKQHSIRAAARLVRGARAEYTGTGNQMLRALAQVEGAQFFVVMTECSDPTLHRSRVDSRQRGIPDWYRN